MARQKAPLSTQVALGNNPERNRTHNRRVVLDALRLHGPLGRTAIARLAQITPQAVSNIVGELLAEGLLVEHGRRRSGRGLPPVQVAVNPDGGMTIGAEIAADRLTLVLVDLVGRVRGSRTVPLADTAPDHIGPLLRREIDLICAREESYSRLLGVGVVMPGPFGIEGLSSVGPTTLPGWAGLDVPALLSQATGQMTLVENDATAAAVGERLHGAARDLQDFCLVYFGAGLGLGIVHAGRPLRGAYGNAGEIGHIVAVPRGKPCPCGNRGCLEQYVSFHALKEALAAAGVQLRSGADLERLYEDRHHVLLAWISEAAAHLASVVVLLENLLDPESIFLGGALPEAILDAIIRAMEPLPLSVSSRRQRTVPRVQRGTTGQLTAALGAAALPLFETIMPRLDMAVSRAEPVPVSQEDIR